MAMVETAMPMRKAKRCNAGVAPTMKPVFRSCEVSPASAEAMHTTPPMVMASAPKAGAVQPLTRKMAEVAISVAMVMPEMGLAELPIRPTMRELTVTKRNPKATTRTDAARLANKPTCAPGTGLNSEEEEHEDDERDGADDGGAHGEVALRADGLAPRRPSRAAIA